MVEWVCRWKPCWVLIEDTFKKTYFEDRQLVKDGQNYDRVGDSTQSIPLAADPTNVWTPENSDGTFKHEQIRDSGEDGLQTSAKTTESAKLLKSGAMTSISSMNRLGTLGTPHHYQSLRGKQLENPPRQLGSSRALKVPRPFGKNRKHRCLPKNACAIFCTPSSKVPFPTA